MPCTTSVIYHLWVKNIYITPVIVKNRCNIIFFNLFSCSRLTAHSRYSTICLHSTTLSSTAASTLVFIELPPSCVSIFLSPPLSPTLLISSPLPPLFQYISFLFAAISPSIRSRPPLFLFGVTVLPLRCHQSFRWCASTVAPHCTRSAATTPPFTLQGEFFIFKYCKFIFNL